MSSKRDALLVSQRDLKKSSFVSEPSLNSALCQALHRAHLTQVTKSDSDFEPRPWLIHILLFLNKNIICGEPKLFCGYMVVPVMPVM